MNKPFQITIPADVLVEKVNSYPMVLWVKLDAATDDFIGLYTTEEMEHCCEVEIIDKLVPKWEKVELTLADLLQRGTDDED